MDIVSTVTAPARISFKVVVWGARTVGGLLPLGNGDEPAPPAPAEEPPAQAQAPAPAPAPAPAQTGAPPAPPAPEPTAERPEPAPPAHVDEGATVVAEFAEGGAEDGAGAEVELAEPWEGYDRLHADELIDGLTGASSEKLAAVLLYERSTRNRTSVVEAAE